MTSTAVRERRPRGLRALGLGLAAGSLLVWSGVASAASPPESFSGLAKKVTPSVVSIMSAHEVSRPEARMPNLPFAFPEGSPFEEFFKQFRERHGERGDGPSQPRMAAALGSGFIVDPSGYVVTNNHVVDGASEVEVRLEDDSVHPAELVGTDPQTDLALLKIDAGRPLPAVPFGDSDVAEVGDWVMAVGNPFGLGNTVTTGIVSARGRNIQAGPYDDFLQIDAPINRGNSGGPLFDMGGAVIGVNTAIFSPNGGSVGIGFAIPSNIAKDVVAQLRDSGKVERGWLGVQIQPVTPDIAGALGLDEDRGALVTRIVPDSPAAKAGLRQGDVVQSFAGKPVEGPRELARIVAGEPVGSRTPVAVWREGRERSLTVEIAPQPGQDRMAAAPSSGPASGDTYRSGDLGAELAALTPERRSRFGIEEAVNGVLVLDVKQGSAFDQGLRAGDVIKQVGQTTVDTPAEVEALVQAAKSDSKKAVLVLISRQGQELFLGLKLGTA